jgi:hypothetical protein
MPDTADVEMPLASGINAVDDEAARTAEGIFFLLVLFLLNGNS